MLSACSVRELVYNLERQRGAQAVLHESASRLSVRPRRLRLGQLGPQGRRRSGVKACTVAAVAGLAKERAQAAATRRASATAAAATAAGAVRRREGAGAGDGGLGPEARQLGLEARHLALLPLAAAGRAGAVDDLVHRQRHRPGLARKRKRKGGGGWGGAAEAG